MVDKFISKFYILQGKKNFNIISLIILVGIVFLSAGVVYISGGTTSFVHLMYIPIILSVFIFNIKTGIIISILAGATLGPFMPFVVSQGIQQAPISWVFRVFMFFVIAIVTGVLFEYVKAIHNLEKEKYYTDIVTGYPNTNKLTEDVSKLINEKKFKTISFVMFEFNNREMINQYVNYEIGQKTYVRLLKMTEEFFGKHLYSTDNKRFVALIPGSNAMEACQMTEEFYRKVKKPIYIEKLPVSIILKSAIVSYPQHSTNIDDIRLKLGQTLSQAIAGQKNIIIYDDDVQSVRTKYYNTLVSLYYSLQNDMFTVNYQPKIQISNNKLIGVEALLRIQDESSKDISVQQLITIAEEVGFINEITKWVIRKVFAQIKVWREQGLEIKVSINLSYQDFNESIYDYTQKCLEYYKIEPASLEFELTERSTIEDESKVRNELSLLKNSGIKLSLDDYGTGHNSLFYLTNSAYYFDYIKIDKVFIDEITDAKTKLLVAGIIETAHVQGMEVIAEGVETQEQLDTLKEINCDHAQGYYFSKAIPPEELVKQIEIGEFRN